MIHTDSQSTFCSSARSTSRRLSGPPERSAAGTTDTDCIVNNPGAGPNTQFPCDRARDAAERRSRRSASQVSTLSRPPGLLPRIASPTPVQPPARRARERPVRSEEHTSELQSPDHLVCRLLLEKKKQMT